jgi:hypothetical protein
MQYRDLLKVKVSLRTLALDRLAKVDRFVSSLRSIRLRTFRRRLSEREFERQEFEMLRRMTALLSAVVVVLLAAVVPNAIFATPAHAAENCLSGPSGAAPDGGYWYSQTNPITRQKCWMIGTGKAKATDSGISLPAWLNFGSSKEVSEKEVAEPAPAAGCLAAPNGQAPEGRHWVYRIDNTTGQRCWHLGDQASRIRVSRIKASRTHVSRSEVSRSEVSRDQVSRDEVSEIRPASPSRAPAKSAAPEAPAANLPPGIADANARLVDRSSAPSPPPNPVGAASSPAAVVSEIAKENQAAPSFELRWTDPSDQIRSSDRESKPVDFSELRQPDPAAPNDVARSTKASAAKVGTDLPATRRPLDVSLLIFLGSLGGALILFGLAGRSFFYRRSSPSAWSDLPPHDVLRVAEFTSSPNSPNGSEPEAASEWQNAMDALLRLVGGRSTDRDPPRDATGDPRLGDRRGRQSRSSESR